MKKIHNKQQYGDLSLLFLVLILSIFGVVMIYSASSYSAKADYNDSFFFAKKQIYGLVIGAILMFIMAKFSHLKLIKLQYIAPIVAIIMLVLVFIPGVGKESYGAKRWINLGIITLQPSEIAKFSFVIFSASYAYKNSNKISTLKGVMPIIIIGVIFCILIILEPNMSITMCVALLMVSVLFFCGLKFKFFLMLLIPIILLVPILILIEPYRLQRLYAFINPWANPKGEGYQLIQSLYALGSGGWFGVGIFNSRQKFEFLPFAESDFILSVIGEELGYIGLVILFIIMFIVIAKGFIIMSRSKNLFSFILAGGITMIYCLQVMINALVVTGSIPPTGLSLPLISAGNTSLIVFMGGMGILYNISKYNNA